MSNTTYKAISKQKETYREQRFLKFPPIFYVLYPIPQILLETFCVVIPPGVAGLEVENAVVGVADVVEVAEPEVVFVVDLELAEPEVVFVGILFVALVCVGDVAEPQASVDIALAFDVLVPLSVFVVEVGNSGLPKFHVFPNVHHYAISSSSVELDGEVFVHSSIDVRTNDGLCSILSNLGLHQNRNLGHAYNKPNPGYNNVSDTNDLPMDATTNHSRKTDPLVYKVQRTHRSYRATLLLPEVPQIRRVVAEKFQYLYLPLPLLE